MICKTCGRNRDCFWEGACFGCYMYGPDAAAAEEAITGLKAEREQAVARIAEIDHELARIEGSAEAAA